MSRGTALDAGQQIDADQIARIDISREAGTAEIEVRIYMAGVDEPHVFTFDSMAAAVAFYEQLWSRRTADDGSAASSYTG